MLRQRVGDLVPRCFGRNEDMHRRSDARFVLKRAHRDMDICSTSHNRIEQRSAVSTAHVVSGTLVAINQKAVTTAL